ncbi:MAG: NAD kinase [Bacteroidaceae bacterium]|nr:NAD kinase [Bacteroidaceae bacterium]
MQFAIFGNPSASKAKLAERNLFELIHSMGDTICIESDYYDYLTNDLGWNIHCNSVFKDDQFVADSIITIGGDGTFLRTASRTAQKGIPMIGINTGRLGFMADINIDRTEEALKLIHDGKFTIQKRSMLELCMENLPENYSRYALNDIAILKHDVSSMINIKAKVNNTPLTTYMADGLVIATPTGSTAYSLSVGGPIVFPETDIITVTPVAPHSLTIRPLVLSNDQTISLSVKSRSGNFLVSIDGNSFSCPEETLIQIKKAPFHINVMKPDGYDFFSTLRDKMMWGADNREN